MKKYLNKFGLTSFWLASMMLCSHGLKRFRQDGLESNKVCVSMIDSRLYSISEQ